ncbi:MAG: PAS domain-containing protein [Dehalococcoidia bacterium]|nr:PAS domain-containing protein [Dehalococcoidia bacterium]
MARGQPGTGGRDRVTVGVSLEDMPVAVIVADRHATVVAHNQAALDLLQISSEELAARLSDRGLWDAIYEDGRPVDARRGPIRRALAGESVRNEVIGLRIPGQPDRCWVMVAVETRPDDLGQVYQAVCTFTDISEHMRQDRRTSDRIVSRFESALAMLNPLDTSGLLHAAALRSESLLESDGAAVLLRESEGQNHVAVVGLGVLQSQIGAVVSSDDATVAAVVGSGQPQVADANAIDVSSRLQKAVRGACELAMVPLRVANDVVGVLAVARSAGQPAYAPPDLELLARLADATSYSLEHLVRDESLREQVRLQTPETNGQAEGLLLDTMLGVVGRPASPAPPPRPGPAQGKPARPAPSRPPARGQAAAQPGEPRRAERQLTKRELDVLQLVALGRSNSQIAAELVISENTVGSHLSHILRKIGVNSRTSAVVHALAHGMISPISLL